MKIEAELKSESSGYVPDFGYVSPDKPLWIDEFKMVRLEAKRKCKFGEILMPYGVELTIHLSEEKDEGQ